MKEIVEWFKNKDNMLWYIPAFIFVLIALKLTSGVKLEAPILMYLLGSLGFQQLYLILKNSKYTTLEELEDITIVNQMEILIKDEKYKFIDASSDLGLKRDKNANIYISKDRKTIITKSSLIFLVSICSFLVLLSILAVVKAL